jgi:hypothetical protein
VTNSKLTPTYREIVFLMAERYYPREWSSVVEQSVGLVQSSSGLKELLGAVEALKAVYSVFGGSISRQIELGNLCNRSWLPLLALTSKLFQNFDQATSHVLVPLFKLLSTALMFYLPDIVQLNIHSLMIFPKKTLDLPADLGASENHNLYLLKRISLRILFRLYAKHAHPRMTEHRDFALKFHAAYTKPFLETLMLQVMLKTEVDRAARKRGMELAKLSLSILSYINRQNSEAAGLLLEHREAILRLCFEKFGSSLSRNYYSFAEFKLHTHEQRVHLKEFVVSLLSCEALPAQKEGCVTATLGLLLEYLEKGDNEQKELALYLFTELSTELKHLKEVMDETMVALVLNYVKPLLGEQHHILLRARACELLSSYSYLELPEEQIKDLAGLVYSCLLVGNSEKEVFLKVYACNAFNSLMKYPQIAEFIRPSIPEVLRIYTDLLQTDPSIIKNFQDLLNLLEEEVAPYANDLCAMFIRMFFSYAQNESRESAQPQEGERDDEEDSSEDEEDTNFEACARACISSIRQILQADSTRLSEEVRGQLLELVVWVFSEQSQSYIEEGFNVLNLVLYRLEGPPSPSYFLFFRMIVYAILGFPQEQVAKIRSKGDPFSRQYADILQNVSVDPDKDLLENSIGCLRNFAAKAGRDFLSSEHDDFGISYLEYLFKIVRVVHENESGEATQTDRLIVLTLFITLVEHRLLSNEELAEVTSTVQRWMHMEEEALQAQRSKQQFGSQLAVKYVYTPVYLQILLLAIHFYQPPAEQVDPSLTVEKVLALANSFRCDSELSRVIVGLTHVLSQQLVGQEQLVRDMLEALPELVRRLCSIRQDGDSPENDFDMDDEAEEERMFGDDENTHVMGLQGGGASSKDMQLGGEEDEDEDSDWEEEFNKFYDSPLDRVE